MNNQYKNEKLHQFGINIGYFLLSIGYSTFKMLIKELVASNKKDVYKE
jgi:hypothetical protein